MKNPLVFLFWLIVLGGIIHSYISYTRVTQDTMKQMNQAFIEYLRGEKAATFAERQQAFNHALELYMRFDHQFQPIYGDGILYYNIGNTYFQLREYPWAVLYYYRSLNLMPRSEKTRANLAAALNKLEVSSNPDLSAFRKIFFWYEYTSLPEKFQAFSWFTLAAFLLGSLYIWHAKPWMKMLAFAFGCLSAMMLLAFAYGQYIESAEGVVMRSTPLFRDAGYQYAKVKDAPVLSGNKVKIFQLAGEGLWLKVMTKDNELGYLPADAVKLISQ